MAEEKKVIYVVTDGDYSDYAIRGVFDSREMAEKFQLYHAYQRVEEFDLNPDTPAYHGLAYVIGWSLRQKRIVRSVRRANYADQWHDKRLEYISQDREWSWEALLDCHCLADNEQHAQKIAIERVAAFLAGSTYAIERINRSSQPDGNVNVHQFIDGQPRCVGRETDAQIGAAFHYMT